MSHNKEFPLWTVQVPQELHDRTLALAAREGESLSTIVRLAVKAYLAAEELSR